MTIGYKAAAYIGLALIIVGAIPTAVLSAPLAAVTTGKHKKSDRIEGAVTAIDTTANTITLHSKKLNTDTVVTVTSATKFTKSSVIGLSGLSVGDKIAAQGKGDLAANATTIAADRIVVESPLAEPKKHQSKRSVEGTIASLSPALTITTDDGTTVTVSTTASTRVMESVPAAFTDIAVGEHLQTLGKLAGTTFIASAINIVPAHKRKG